MLDHAELTAALNAFVEIYRTATTEAERDAMSARLHSFIDACREAHRAEILNDPDLRQAVQTFGDVYRERAHDPEKKEHDFLRGQFTVRIWDGMDGCWCDLPEATNVNGLAALMAWIDKTDNAKKNLNFNDIDYWRIFPADTRMKYDGSPGREMFRESDDTDDPAPPR